MNRVVAVSVVALSFAVAGCATIEEYAGEIKAFVASFEAEAECMKAKGEFLKINGEFVCVAEPFRETEVVNRP